jgi:hypothetical protein
LVVNLPGKFELLELTFLPIILQTGGRFRCIPKEGRKSMSKSTLRLLPVLLIAISALMAQPIFGGPVTPANNQLVITENSSTSLTATYNGSSVPIVFVSPDLWFFPGGALGGPPINFAPQQWTEPENSNLVNSVNFNPGGLIFSDAMANSQFPINANGASVQVGTDPFNGLPVIATFNDLGDVARVPDTGTTASLFGLSLAGLGFFRRKVLPNG